MDWFNEHPGFAGYAFLAALAVFPRLAMLFGMATPFGWLAWVGWVVAPHVTVAIFASIMYWDTNPFLVIIAWFFALGGTSAEGSIASGRRRKKE